MTNDQLKVAAQQILVNNILPFWSERMVDNEQGGFYGRIDGHDILHPEAEKGAVLNARILWTFAGATRILHKMPYRILAARAKDYLLTHFVDPQYGGVYWSLNADGTPLDTKKQTYAIAFAIYGLAEYHRATGDREALFAAIRLFDDIESHAFQQQSCLTSNSETVQLSGYIEALTRDWRPIADMRLSESDENGSRTMNTHLHVLEAYTSLYRVWKNERVAQQLRVLIDIFVHRLFNPANGHLDLFFDDEWKPLTAHRYSPGHDIEAAWLLREALLVLGDQELLQQTLPVCRRLAVAARDGIQMACQMGSPRILILGESVEQDGASLSGGAANHANLSSSDTQWWCYAEAVVGYVDQYEDIRDPHQWQMAEKAFAFIESHLLDREHGEWFWSVLPDGTPNRKEDKAGFWKCPYHNSRMCFELIERL